MSSKIEELVARQRPERLRLIYSRKPHDYLSVLSELLTTLHTKPDLFEDILTTDEWNQDHDVPPRTNEDIQRLADVGLVWLRSYVNETTLRYYLAHVTSVHDPLLAIREFERNAQGDWKRQNSQIFAATLQQHLELDSQSIHRCIDEALYGGLGVRHTNPYLTVDEWTDRLVGVEQMLGYYIRRYLDRVDDATLGENDTGWRDINNSMKHGVVAFSHLREFESHQNLAKHSRRFAESAIMFLQYSKLNGPNYPSIETISVNHPRIAAEIFYSIRLLEQVWNIGRCRWAAATAGGRDSFPVLVWRPEIRNQMNDPSNWEGDGALSVKNIIRDSQMLVWQPR